MSRTKQLYVRTITSVAAVGAVFGGMTALATPAQATAKQCVQYLVNNGYVIGGDADKACQQGAEGNHKGCQFGLVGAGVPKAVAASACSRAAD